MTHPEEDPAEDTVTLVVPRAAATRLAQAWESGGDDIDYRPLLRDALGGGDGFLHTLNEALGREH